MIRLNVGCGEFSLLSWLNLDVHVGGPVRPDVRASALALPLADQSCDAVYAGHVMEHIHYFDVVKALQEFRRVLVPGGKLAVVGPDINLARTDQERLGVIYGGQRWPGDAHLWTSTSDLMLEAFAAAGGWNWCRQYPIREAPAAWPIVARVHWQFAFELERK